MARKSQSNCGKYERLQGHGTRSWCGLLVAVQSVDAQRDTNDWRAMAE